MAQTILRTELGDRTARPCGNPRMPLMKSCECFSISRPSCLMTGRFPSEPMHGGAKRENDMNGVNLATTRHGDTSKR